MRNVRIYCKFIDFCKNISIYRKTFARYLPYTSVYQMGVIHAVTPSILIPLYMTPDKPQTNMLLKPAQLLDYTLTSNKILPTQPTPKYFVTPLLPTTDYNRQFLYNYVNLATRNKSNIISTTILPRKIPNNAQYHHVASRIRMLDTPFSASNMQTQHLLQSAAITQYQYPIIPATTTISITSTPTSSTSTAKTPTTSNSIRDDLEFIPTWYPYVKQQSKFNSFFTIEDAITPFKPLEPITYKSYLDFHHEDISTTSTSTTTKPFISIKTTPTTYKTTTMPTYLSDFTDELTKYEEKLQKQQKSTTTPTTFLSDLFDFITTTHTTPTTTQTTTMPTRQKSINKINHSFYSKQKTKQKPTEFYKNVYSNGEGNRDAEEEAIEIGGEQEEELKMNQKLHTMFNEATESHIIEEEQAEKPQKQYKLKENSQQQVFNEATELYAAEYTNSNLKQFINDRKEQKINKKLQQQEEQPEPILNEQIDSLQLNDFISIEPTFTTTHNITTIKPLRMRNINTTNLRLSPYLRKYNLKSMKKIKENINNNETTDLYNTTIATTTNINKTTSFQLKLPKTYVKKRRFKSKNIARHNKNNNIINNNEEIDEENINNTLIKPRKKYTHKLKRIRPIKQQQQQQEQEQQDEEQQLNKNDILTTAISFNNTSTKRRLRSSLLPHLKLQQTHNKLEKIITKTTTIPTQTDTTQQTFDLNNLINNTTILSSSSSSSSSSTTTTSTSIPYRGLRGRNRGRSPYNKNLQDIKTKEQQKQQEEQQQLKRKKSQYSRQYTTTRTTYNNHNNKSTTTTSSSSSTSTTTSTIKPTIETAIMRITKATYSERQRKINNLLENLLIPITTTATSATKLIKDISTEEYPKLPIEVYFQKIQNNF